MLVYSTSGTYYSLSAHFCTSWINSHYVNICGYFTDLALVWYCTKWIRFIQLNNYETGLFFRFSKVRVVNPFVNLKLHPRYITLRIYRNQNKNNFTFSVFSSQILHNAEMNIIMHWKFWRKYGSVLLLFSSKKCMLGHLNKMCKVSSVVHSGSW